MCLKQHEDIKPYLNVVAAFLAGNDAKGSMLDCKILLRDDFI